MSRLGWCALLWIVGCGEVAADEAGFATAVQPRTNWDRDVVSASLKFDLATNKASATIAVGASPRRGASFDVRGLDIATVTSAGSPLKYRIEEGRLDVGVAAKKPAEMTVEYGFELRDELEGAVSSGLTFLWPYYCGNLFPCKSDPADGLKVSLELVGVPNDQVAVYPKEIAADAPSYMPAWAIGDYTEIELGTTAAGRRVSVYHLPGEEGVALEGTKNLVAEFEWLEKTYGEYLYGDEVASVSVHWGAGAYGGMEHHPYWHVSHASLGSEETHAHEAAHGWFGDGVRIACWEDLTLSEGTVSYLAARAVEAIGGEAAGAKVWSSYESRLDSVIATQDRIALPDGCGTIDVLKDLFNSVPYMKGAFFYRAVEQAVGRDALDRAIAAFYAERRGQAATMQDMLDTIESETGFDPTGLADAWLRSMGRP